MPCRDEWAEYEEIRLDWEAQTEKIHKLTRLLCEAAQRLDDIYEDSSCAYGDSDSWSEELSDWWNEHQEADRKRAEKEERELYERLRRKYDPPRERWEAS